MVYLLCTQLPLWWQQTVLFGINLIFVAIGLDNLGLQLVISYTDVTILGHKYALLLEKKILDVCIKKYYLLFKTLNPWD